MTGIAAATVLEQLDVNDQSRTLIFAPWCYGHHPTYLRHLVNYWSANPTWGKLDILVSPQFLHEHNDVVELSDQGDLKTVSFIAMTAQEYAELEANPAARKRAFLQYRLIDKYANQLKPTQGLILYLDSCLLPLVLGAKLPCPFSGIYYRPTLHYTQLTNYKPSRSTWLQHWKERFFLYRLQRNPSIKTLFSLDPLAVDVIKQIGGTAQVLHLPDPVPFVYSPDRPVQTLKQQLGIDPDRKVFLCFGRLSEERKGVPQLVEAVTTLPADLRERLCLLFAGEPSGYGNDRLEAWLAPLREMTSVQIVNCSGYISESDVPTYFQLADVVLAPYQMHVGMSGILLLAAAARKPLLGSDYGLMGEMIRQHGLGLAINTTAPTQITQAMVQFLQDEESSLCDRDKMQAFVEESSVERFTRIIFENL